MQTNVISKLLSMQNTGILQGLKETQRYCKHIDVINEAIKPIPLYNKNVKTVGM